MYLYAVRKNPSDKSIPLKLPSLLNVMHSLLIGFSVKLATLGLIRLSTSDSIFTTKIVLVLDTLVLTIFICIMKNKYLQDHEFRW